MPEKDELDLLLDSALARYADPGVEAGLERRVLASLTAARCKAPTPDVGPRSRRRWLWAIAIPITASLLFFWVSTSKIRRAPSLIPQQAHRTAPATIVPHPQPPKELRSRVAPRPSRQKGEAAPVRTGDAAPFPKLDVFPTPQPLTAEERALAAVAVQAPPTLRQALVASQQKDDAPVRIAAIHIPPIERPSSTQP